MALNNSLTTAGAINSDTANALDLDRFFAGIASGDFLPPSYYSSNIVEKQIGSLEPIAIDFQGSPALASTTSSGLLGNFIPPILEALPLNLGYIRTAAFSIAEACYQLSKKLKKPLSHDELKMIIIENIKGFFEKELNRIQSFTEEDNVILHPTLSKRFTAVEFILNTQIGNFNEYIHSHEIPVHIQTTKGGIEKVIDSRQRAANDDSFELRKKSA